MGTYYTIGVITDMKANANRTLTEEEWKEALFDRIDLDCFQLVYGEEELSGVLDEAIFKENIGDFYALFRKILGKSGSFMFDRYEEEYGHVLENYDSDWTSIRVEGKDGLRIELRFGYALLLREGKVMVEEFSVEPTVLNWLFRNSKIENKLAGCVISDITG